MKISEINPFIRAAMIQPAVIEGSEPRLAYDYRIFLVLKGKGRFYYEGEFRDIEEGHLLIFPPEREYYFRGKLKVLVLNFDITRSHKDEKRARTPLPRNQFKRELLFDETRASGFEALHHSVISSEEAEPLYEIVKFRGEDAITSGLLKGFLAKISAKKGGSEPFYSLSSRVLFYIRSNAAEISTNKQVGEALGYHPNYIASVVAEATGKSLHELILEEKIALAKRWLISTEESIESIAFSVGFSSRNHFCTAFKKLVGKTPKKYRTEKTSIY